MKFSITTRLSAILFALSFLLYANTLHHGYVLDDGLVITNNKLVKMGVKAIPDLLTSPHLKGYGTIANETYRPLSLVMFAAEIELFGAKPVVGHLVNVLLFAGCVVLLFLFFDKFFDRKKTVVAFVSALLFAVHPIHTEVVANIKSCDELLCFFFAFMSLNAYLDYARNGNKVKLIMGIISLFLSFLSKETVITFAAVIPVIFFLYANGNKKRSIVITLNSIVIVVVYLGIRALALKGSYETDPDTAIRFMDNQLVNVPAGASRLATELLVLGYYIKQLVLPYPLLCNYAYCTIPFTDFSNTWVILSVLLYLFLSVVGIYRMLKLRKDLWAFGIFFFLITISLFSNILFLLGAVMAERFLFFPSIAFCLIIALAIEKWIMNFRTKGAGITMISLLWSPRVLLVVIPILSVFGYLTYARNGDWKDNYSLYSADVKKAPDNGWLCYGMGNILINKNDPDPDLNKQIRRDAMEFLKRAVIYCPDNINAQGELGYVYVRAGMLDSAEKYIRYALVSDPDNQTAIASLGMFYYSKKEFSKALALFKIVLKKDPKYVTEYDNMGICFWNLQQYDSAVVYFKKALISSADNKHIFRQIALTYKAMGKTDSALKYGAMSGQPLKK